MRTRKIEDPDRLEDFLSRTVSLDWSSSKDSLSVLKNEAFRLLKSEVEYYYRVRQSKKRISTLLRIGMLIFGALGILAPLAEVAKLCEVGAYGYLLLAISGVFLTANNLFGGTLGHVRMVMTQLQLERIITVGTIKWSELEREFSQDLTISSEVELKMFRLITDSLESSYKLILDETNDWQESLKSAMEEFEKKFKPNNNKGN